MKEELQSNLVEILTSIQTATGKAADFAVEQLPDIAQSYVAYGQVWAALAFVIGMASTVAVFAASYRWLNPTDGASSLLGVFVGVPLAIFTVTQLHALILVSVAPKVWQIGRAHV